MEEFLAPARVVTSTPGRFSKESLGPINGIDYLVDYYALLGAARTATAQEIHSLFRKASSEWHPDKYASLAAPLREQAERQFKILREADTILTNDVRRAHYDELLATFPEDLLSKTGTPILDLRRRKVNLPLLIAGSELDVSEMEKRVEALSGHNEAAFALLEQWFQATPTPNEQIRSAYKDALEKKHAYLTLREELEWQALGLNNQDKVQGIASPEEHVNARIAQLEDAKKEISRIANSTLKLLGSGETIKLLGMGGETTDEVPLSLEAAHKQLVARGEERLNAISPRLETAARKTADAMNQLLELTQWSYYSDNKDGNQHQSLALVLIIGGVPKAAVRCAIDNGSVALNNVPFEQRGTPQESLAYFKTNLPSDVSVATVAINPELDIVLQLGFVMSKHLGNILGNSVAVSGRVIETTDER